MGTPLCFLTAPWPRCGLPLLQVQLEFPLLGELKCPSCAIPEITVVTKEEHSFRHEAWQYVHALVVGVEPPRRPAGPGDGTVDKGKNNTDSDRDQARDFFLNPFPVRKF